VICYRREEKKRREWNTRRWWK